MLYKRLDNGVFRWPRNEKEARLLTEQEIRWLLEGLEIDQPKAIKPGKKAKTDSRMWVYCSGKYEKYRNILFEYQPTRNGDHAKRFLGSFSGYLVCDGFDGYNKLTTVKRSDALRTYAANLWTLCRLIKPQSKRLCPQSAWSGVTKYLQSSVKWRSFLSKNALSNGRGK